METRIRYKGEPPFTREEAVSEGCGTYIRPPALGKFCPACHCDRLYTENNECAVCFCTKLWNEAKANPHLLPIGTESALALGLNYTINGRYCLDGPHLKSPSINLNGPKCVICANDKAAQKEKKRTGTPRHLAIAAGETWYMPDKPCPRCLTISMRAVANGACKGCKPAPKPERVLTPRLIAKAAGQMKYLPTEPCPYCQGVHMKRVDNGACDGCAAKAREVSGKPSLTPTMDEGTRAVMAAMGPDYLVDRNQAKAMGLTAYRDGKYCPEGHTGWKFLANDSCVTCKGEDHE